MYTKSRAEKRVYDELLKQGINAYIPTRKELKCWSDRKKWVETPIISSYVFVNIQAENYLKVFNANGVLSYVSRKGKPVVIPDREMSAMKRMVDSNLSFDVEAKTIRRGQNITIKSGPLAGITGKVVEIQGKKKFFITISHIGYSLVVTLDD